MFNSTLTCTRIAMLIATVLGGTAPAAWADEHDDVGKVISTCTPDDGDYTPAVVGCFRSVFAKVEREMNAAYQQRLEITTPSFRRDLVSVQKLWAQSTEANCKFFGSGASTAATYECLIGAMIERKQTLEAID